MIISTAIIVAIGLAIVNFLRQVISPEKNWSVAFERTFFQIGALIAFVLALLVQ